MKNNNKNNKSITYDDAWKALIKPERFTYPNSYLTNYLNDLYKDRITIEYLTIKTRSSYDIKGTLYKVIPYSENLVIYLHTRGGSQIEGLFILNDILPKINYLIFDFGGSGKSGGEFISLGIHEKEDLHDIITYIKKEYNFKNIILWGRSMGAITAILYADKYQGISGLILDSPFSNFKNMIHDIIKSYNNKIPLCLVNILLFFILRTINKKIGANLDSISPTAIVNKLNIPAIYLVGKDDKIARPDRVKEMYNKHLCSNKHFYFLEGEHQTVRDKGITQKCLLFIYELFHFHI